MNTAFKLRENADHGLESSQLEALCYQAADELDAKQNMRTETKEALIEFIKAVEDLAMSVSSFAGHSAVEAVSSKSLNLILALSKENE